MSDLLNMPTTDDLRVINPQDLKPCHRYYYYQVSCINGIEEGFTYHVPTIKSFYLKPVDSIQDWQRTLWIKDDCNKKFPSNIDYNVVKAVITNTSSTRVNNSLVTVCSLTEEVDFKDQNVLGERSNKDFMISRGRGLIFSNNRKHTYIYRSKRDCMLSLIDKVEESVKEMNKAMEYVNNQLYSIEVFSKLSSTKTSHLPTFLPSGSTIWISRYNCYHSNNFNRERYGTILNSFWQFSIPPTPIKIIQDIKDWNNDYGFDIYSHDIIDDYTNCRWISVGRTEEECKLKFISEKKNELERAKQSIKYHLESQTYRLNNLKKSVEKL